MRADPFARLLQSRTLTLLVGAAMTGLAVTGCTPEGLRVVNQTDAQVTISATADRKVVVATIGPHEERRVGLSVGGDGCNPDVGYSALGPGGRVLSSLGRACNGDSWTVK